MTLRIGFGFCFYQSKLPGMHHAFHWISGLKQPRSPCVPSFAALTSVVLVWIWRHLLFGPATSFLM